MIRADISELKADLRPWQRLLGLDLGEKTIGLALSDTLLKVASPLKTLKRSKFTADAAVLGSLIAEHGIGGLVIGLPLMAGTVTALLPASALADLPAVARTVAGNGFVVGVVVVLLLDRLFRH